MQARRCGGALGTQTNGSVVRPASFNGVVGFKPGYGRISVEGVLPLAWPLDHVGMLTRSVEDAHLLWHLLRDDRSLEWQATGGKLPPALLPRPPRRVWRVREYFESEADPAMRAVLEAASERLVAQGVGIVERQRPPCFAGMHEAHQLIMASEAATVHRAAFEADGTAFPPKIARLIREGRSVTAMEYIGALRHRLRMQRLPAVAVPAGLSGEGLPLGLQWLGRAGREDDLLGIAAWCEGCSRSTPSPGAPEPSPL